MFLNLSFTCETMFLLLFWFFFLGSCIDGFWDQRPRDQLCWLDFVPCIWFAVKFFRGVAPLVLDFPPRSWSPEYFSNNPCRNQWIPLDKICVFGNSILVNFHPRHLLVNDQKLSAALLPNFLRVLRRFFHAPTCGWDHQRWVTRTKFDLRYLNHLARTKHYNARAQYALPKPSSHAAWGDPISITTYAIVKAPQDPSFPPANKNSRRMTVCLVNPDVIAWHNFITINLHPCWKHCLQAHASRWTWICLRNPEATLDWQRNSSKIIQKYVDSFFQFLFCRLCLGYRTRLESWLSVYYSMCCQNPVWTQLTRGRAETSISPEMCDKDILCKLQLDQNRAGNMLSSERLKGSSPFKTWEWGCFCFWTYFSELWITARFNQHWFASCRFVHWLR